MKFATEELLLAAHVRTIADELRTKAARVEWKAHGSPGTADGFAAEYRTKHSIVGFVPAVIEELKGIAETLRISQTSD